MAKNFKMNLLNSKEASYIKGGNSCTKAGDTITSIFGQKFILCASHEVNCEKNFRFDCSSLKEYDFNCQGVFDINPIKKDGK